LRNSQFPNRRFVFWLPSGQSPICTGDQPFSLAFRSTTDLRRRSFSGSAFQLNYRPLPTVRLFDLPSDQPPTCVGDQSVRPAFQPTFDSRLQPTFQLNLRIDLRLAPLADPLACLPINLQLAPSTDLPANLLADFQLAPSFNLPVPPSNLTSDSHRPLIPSALPSSQPAARAADQPSSPA